MAITLIVIIIVASINSATTCSLDSCNRKKVDSGRYCEKHTCKYTDCTGLAFDGYCYSHTCHTSFCDSRIVDGSEYCYTHKCKNENCGDEKEYDSDYCSKHKIDMRTRLSNEDLRFDINSAGGIELYFEAKNKTKKDIKYIRFPVYLKNAVGDPITAGGGRNNYFDVEIIGPIKSNETAKIKGDIIGYCDNLARIDIRNITIIYMDGTSESGYWGYYNAKAWYSPAR